jgi:hypothetical protein
MRAAEQHQHPPLADRHRADRTAVALHGRHGEPGQLGERHLDRRLRRSLGRRLTEPVRGRPPARSQHYGDIVAIHPGARGQLARRRLGQCLMIFRGSHVGEPSR